MPQVTIENPILNLPYKEPSRHFKFSDEGITNEKTESRRVSSYFVPIAKPKKKAGGKQLTLESEWTQDRVEEIAGKESVVSDIISVIKADIGLSLDVKRALVTLIEHLQNH